MIYLRGEQISGEYATGSLLDDDGWFCTRDRGWVDADGYLFIEGRADDTIIRGGENIAPAEIEEVLLAQPAVAEACVVGLPDDEWGQRIVAAVVLRDGASTSGRRSARRGTRRAPRIEDPGPDRVPRLASAHRHGQDAPDRVVLQEMLEHHHSLDQTPDRSTDTRPHSSSKDH